MQRRPNIATYHEVFEAEEIDFGHELFANNQRIIAEGDSWFTIGGLQLQYPWFSNIIYTLRFSDSRTLILNLAEPGDTVKNISSMVRNDNFRFALQAHRNNKWHAILLSAGGNDLIDGVDGFLLNKNQRATSASQAEDYINLSEFNALLNRIENNYRLLAAMRGNRDIPIVVHTYDYPTPNNSPSRFFGAGLLGPWLFKAMQKAGIPTNKRVVVTDYLFEKLADTILNLGKGSNKISNFHVVDTRGLLNRASLGSTGESGDWLNEIHPNKKGYEKIARAIEEKLKMVAGIQ